VASTVGLMSSEIFGYKRKEALIYAEAMGIAMQMTNILRDVGEDASMNRIYLPREDLLRFGVSEEQILKHQLSDNFIELMKFEIKRTRDFYREAEKGIPLLEKDVRFTVLIASKIYEKILDKIEEQNYDVFRKRAHTNLAQKIVSLPKIWIESKRLIAK
jgi:phytoene synthase